MRAILMNKNDKSGFGLQTVDDPILSNDGVRIAIEYSSMNYKDALIVTGVGGLVREFPMVAGIDFAGHVLESNNPDFKTGDAVVCTGLGLSETHWGGYAEQACVPSNFLCHLPKGRDARWAMQLGTAGFTAMMAVIHLERAKALSLDGPVIVTGAGGGVGGIALIILAALNHQVYALSGRSELKDYLTALGAHQIVSREEARKAKQPLDSPRWSAIVDNVGGDILAGLLAQLQYNGAAALCGLAASASYSANVIPFLLRGISMHGIDSVHCPMSERLEIWKRLDQLVDDQKLESTTAETISLEQTLDYAPNLLKGQIRGRLLVKTN